MLLNGGSIREMRLNEEQEIVCRIFGRPDRNGRVHCEECPMRLSDRHPVCLKVESEEDAREVWGWDGNPYPALERRE